VPYAPGRLEAIGYNGGRVAARDVRETSGRHARCGCRPLENGHPQIGIIANGAIFDVRGRPVPTAGSLLRFSVEGGQVVGVGNGDPNSIEPDVASNRRAFNGLAQAIVRVGKGPVEVSVASDGLAGSRIRIVAV
jgi:beta-galactosidase